MYHGGVAVYNSNDWKFSSANVYTGGSWKRAIPYVWANGHWTMAGAAGVNMVSLLTNSSQFVLDNTSANILVREK